MHGYQTVFEFLFSHIKNVYQPIALVAVVAGAIAIATLQLQPM